MLKAISRAWTDYRKLSACDYRGQVVFYAESPHDYAYYAETITCLRARGVKVVYVTSSLQDPLLQQAGSDDFRVYFIGSGMVRTMWFSGCRAPVVVMTMPDLETMYLKRSRAATTHYIYLFHSLVSTHLIYRPHAFNHYDTILCGGPHHIDEIRAWEAAHGLPAKNLLPCGYSKIDQILARPVASRQTLRTRRILLAPSWGPRGLLEEGLGAQVIAPLLANGYELELRPHPMTVRHHPDKIKTLLQEFGSHAQFIYRDNISALDAYDEASLMISDWSGAAFEYSFGYLRPVLFIDAPKKINNPHHATISPEPIEVSLREKIGHILSCDALPQVGEHVARLLGEAPSYQETLHKLRQEYVFNLQQSGAMAAQAICKVIEA